MQTQSTRRLSFVFLARLLCICAATSGLAWPQTPDQTAQISHLESNLAKARAAHNQRDEAIQLIGIGGIEAQSEKTDDALAHENQALAICLQIKNRTLEATARHEIGWIYFLKGQMQKALENDNEALLIRREIADRGGEGRTLNNIGQVYSSLGQRVEAMKFFDQAFPIERGVGDTAFAVMTLNHIAQLYTSPDQMQEAIDTYNQALLINQTVGNRAEEATSLQNIGRIYSLMGQMQKALHVETSALKIRRELRDRAGEARANRRVGSLYMRFGDNVKAAEYLDIATDVSREAGNRSAESSILVEIGSAYANDGQYRKAFDYYDHALTIVHDTGDRRSEWTTLNGIGNVLHHQGQMQKALEYYNLALPIARGTGDPRAEATVLINIGWVYLGLGQYQKAIDLCNQTSPILGETNDLSRQVEMLGLLGFTYSQMGKTGDALQSYNKALAIEYKAGYRGAAATTVRNIGSAYSDIHQYQRAIDYYRLALSIHREFGHRLAETEVLWRMGKAFANLGDQGDALGNELAALSLAKTLDDPDMQGRIDDSLMAYFRDQKRNEVAILFGMEAVNSFQQIRRNLSGLNEDLQAGFVQSKSASYRELAELLVQTDRLGEAEKVLDLLKEQELKEVVRGSVNDATSKIEQLKLTTAQEKAQSELSIPEKEALALTVVSEEYATLRAKQALTAADDARLKVLEAQIEAGNGEVSSFFKNTLYPELAQNVSLGRANSLLSSEKSALSSLQNTLAELGPHVIGIRLLLGEQNTYAIVVTANARGKVELKATPAELRNKILEVRTDLRSPFSNPKPHLKELYAMVVSPIEDELKALEQGMATARGQNQRVEAQQTVPTLLWSLDGVLRYLPMSALFDGHRYMVERFNNVLFTPESYGHMAIRPDLIGPQSRMLAMGLSKSYGGLPPLPGVIEELDAVVHDPGVLASHGPMDGKLLADEQFTFVAFKAQLGVGNRFPLVHIASHFVVESTPGAEPYLMIGGESSGASQGFELTLSKLEDSAINFHGTRLLTLSACSTGKGSTAKDGMDVDSLGMIAQHKDAEAVLATLWDVNDQSSSSLMSDFYTRWMKDPADGKAEALRLSQLAFLHGSALAANTSARGRGVRLEHESDSVTSATDYSHPFYWAPFVLTGNYQ
jgi:CHAT domain-containing protein/Tfp pilus assembly protein PilF